jgi:FkbM family methyltransferase
MGILRKKDNIQKAMETILNRHPEIHVIDIGANRGDFVKTVLKINSECQITAIEPLPSLAHSLNEKFKNHINVTIVNKAIVSGPKDLEFTWYPEREELSGFKELTPQAIVDFGIHTAQSVSVETMPAAGLHDPLKRSTFIKIDTQGNDLAILKAIPQTLMHQVVGILCEIPVNGIYNDLPSWIDYLNCLNAEGFEPLCFQDVSRDAKGRIIEFDCIATRRSV